MTVFLKIATAATVLLGPFVDNTDGYTPETALTITAAEVLLSKNGSALSAKNEASAASHSSNGYYAVSLDTVDTVDAGALKIVINESGAFPVWLDCAVLTADAWEALFNGKAMFADVTKWNGTLLPAPDTAGYPKVTIKDGTGTGELDTLSGKVLLQDGAVTAAVVATGAIDADAIANNAIDAGAIATGAITAAKFAAGAIDAAALAADAGTEIADAILKRDMSAVTGEASRSLLNALRFLRNRWLISGATLTVYKEDDSTAAWTAAITGSAGADPVTGSDPA